MSSLDLLNFKYEACPFTHLSFTFIFLHCQLLIWCHQHKLYYLFCPLFYHLICGAVENFFAMSYQCLPYFHFILTTPVGHIDAPII